MSDDDDSDDDLWADLDDEDETTITVSENLKDSVSAAAAAAVPIIHQGDVDEGKVTWIAPSTNGLHNSLKVNEAAKMGRHWFNEGFQPGQEQAVEEAQTQAAMQAVASEQAAMSFSPAVIHSPLPPAAAQEAAAMTSFSKPSMQPEAVMPWSVPVVPTVPQTNSISTWQSTSPPPEQVAPSPAPDPAPAFGGFNFGQPVGGGGGFGGFGAMPMAPLNANPMPDYSNPTPPYDPNPTPPQYDTGAGAMQPMGFGGMGMFGGMPPLGGGGMMQQTPMMEQQPPMMQPASNPAPPLFNWGAFGATTPGGEAKPFDFSNLPQPGSLFG